MTAETDDGDPIGLSSVDTGELSQGDKMSISSWGRRYLNLPENRQTSTVVVTTCDTNSTKGYVHFIYQS